MKPYKHFLLIITIIIIIIISTILLITNYSKQNESSDRELLIYCGTAMIAPMTEIANIIEIEQNCKILFIKGGSGNLLTSIMINQCGDLFLPGSFSFMQKAYDRELIAEDILVGYNKAAIFVQKGNPKNITADLNNFQNKEYNVVIGNPDSSSIGKETKRILQKKGIFENVIAHAKKLPIDAKELIQIIKDKHTDLTINWYAFAQIEENKPFVDTLPIDRKYVKRKRIMLGLLKSSRNPEIASRFMTFAVSEDGINIFKKHGLYTE